VISDDSRDNFRKPEEEYKKDADSHASQHYRAGSLPSVEVSDPK
jgi:hypothetical protein